MAKAKKITMPRSGMTWYEDSDGKKRRISWKAGEKVEAKKVKHVNTDKKVKPAVDFKKKDT